MQMFRKFNISKHIVIIKRNYIHGPYPPLSKPKTFSRITE